MKLSLVVTVLLGAGLLVWGLVRSGDAPGSLPRVVSAAGGFPLTIGPPSGGEVVLEEPPQRILAANAGIVDFLVALVGPERVVALPGVSAEYAFLARGWLEVPRFQGYEAEIVLGYEPDLVLAHSWQSPETAGVLVQSGIPVIVTPVPARWEEVLETIAFLGRILDVGERAEQVRADLERRREALTRSPLHGRGLRALTYSNLGTGGTTAGSGTTTDVLFGLLGLRNAASEAGLTGIQSLDHERLLALDPDLIVVGTVEDGGERPPSAVYLESQPDLAGLQAVRAGRIVALQPRLFTTTSLTLMESAERLATELERLFAE